MLTGRYRRKTVKMKKRKENCAVIWKEIIFIQQLQFTGVTAIRRHILLHKWRPHQRSYSWVPVAVIILFMMYWQKLRMHTLLLRNKLVERSSINHFSKY